MTVAVLGIFFNNAISFLFCIFIFKIKIIFLLQMNLQIQVWSSIRVQEKLKKNKFNHQIWLNPVQKIKLVLIN